MSMNVVSFIIDLRISVKNRYDWKTKSGDIREGFIVVVTVELNLGAYI